MQNKIIGRREFKALADMYKRRGERWAVAASHAHGVDQMTDDLQHAKDDFQKAQDLYTQIAPDLNGASLAEKVSEERGEAEKNLASAQAATTAPKTQEP
ncbi:MAG: hypothetical protein KGN84_12260 [Acidobacteriota bacterium]|nr:hypothetical protein [Acidobacteriota bacterium]